MTPNTEPPSADEPGAESERDAAERDDDGTYDESRSTGGDERSTGGDASHLDDLEDGAGCTEIWETLSEGRE